MSIRRTAALGVATVTAVAAVLAVQPAAFAAGSSDVLSWGALNSSGTNVATTDTLSGALASGTTSTFKFTSSGTTVTITCTAAASTAKTTSNPTAPGTAAMSISQLTFSDGATQCTLSGLSGVTVVSITLKSGTTAVGNITDSPDDLNLTSLNEAVVLHSGLGNITCDYGTTSAVTNIQGAIVNPNSSGTGGSITFANQTVGLISGVSVCGASGSTGTFNATLGGFTDGSGTGSNTAVYDN
ncbi:MAG TPA: hypothetical protein VL551_32765 [Actinospica sp.]|jgi:hypothetical protein|nr:hypothetical protein [Actinospica sp.]